jgi:hypothetical protein
MTDDMPTITNRASGPPKANKPTKPTRSPWAIVRDALFRLRDGLAAQAEQIDALNCSRASVSQRMDKIEGLARAGAKRPKPAASAAPTIGPEEPSACGGKVRRVKFGNAADLYLLVAQPAPSPTLTEMRDALDEPDPTPEHTVTAPIADEDAQ